MSNIVIGASIEDTYISAGLVNLDTRKIVDGSLRRKRVNPQGTADAIITSWTDVLKEISLLNPNSNDIRIGLGLPGPCDYDNGDFLSDDKDRYGSLYQSNIKELITQKLNIDKSSIRLINDAACFFQGEVFGGAVQGFSKSFGITLGMGLGSARYANGKVEDANLWKMPFKESIAENYLSSRWLVHRFQALSGIEVLDLTEMKRYDPHAAIDQTFGEFVLNLADFIIHIIKTENPDVVLIGGHMETSSRYFFDKLTATIKAAGYKNPILRTFLGEKAMVVGAASTWYDSSTPMHK